MNTDSEANYELIESFVHQVGQYLPESQRLEISKDLKGALYEELESVAEEENRAVTEKDLLRVIGGFGHPLKVAGRYLPQRYLIGPAIFPIYTRMLRTFVTIAVVAIVGFGLVMNMSGEWTMSIWQLFGTTFEIALWICVAITSVFVAIEYGSEKLDLYEKWQPKELARDAVGPIDRSDVITNMLSEGFFLLWWNDVLAFQNFLPEQAIELSLAPVWYSYDLALNILFGVSFMVHAYVLVVGTWRRFAMIGELVCFTGMIGLGLVLLMGDPLIAFPEVVSEKLTSDVGFDVINAIASVVLATIVAFTLWDVLKTLKMWRGGYDVIVD